MNHDKSPCCCCTKNTYQHDCESCLRRECNGCWYPLRHISNLDAHYFCTLCGEEEVYGP